MIVLIFLILNMHNTNYFYLKKKTQERKQTQHLLLLLFRKCMKYVVCDDTKCYDTSDA